VDCVDRNRRRCPARPRKRGDPPFIPGGERRLFATEMSTGNW
jgi:hypothetical protein